MTRSVEHNVARIYVSANEPSFVRGNNGSKHGNKNDIASGAEFTKLSMKTASVTLNNGMTRIKPLKNF